MLKVEFEKKDLENFLREMNFSNERISRLNSKISFLIENDIKRVVFRDEKNEDGSPWPRMKSPRKTRKKPGSPRRKKVKVASRQKLLEDTRNLKNNIFSDFDSSEVTVGTDVRYARAHHEGLGNLPVREFMYARAELQDDMFDFFEREFEDALAKIRG